MRWPFRRRRETAAHTAAPEAAATPAAAATTPTPAPASGGRQWAALPVIPVTISRAAPLVAGPAPVLPPLRPATRGASAPEVAPATGSVTGIAQPVPVTAAEPVADVPLPQPLPPAPVVRRAVRSTPAEAPVLTDAVDEYLGEPREALEPYRAPSWLRYATNPGLPVFPGLPGPEPETAIAEPPSFLPPELRAKPEPAPEPPPSPVQANEPPPRMVEGVERAEAPVRRPMRPRRPNLGQSRRLGLGAPIPAPAKEDLVHPEAPPRVVDGVVEPATPQEPPPPPAAPVRVVAEPEPRPAPAPEPEPAPEPAPEQAPAPRPGPPSAQGTPPVVRPKPPAEGPAPEKRAVATSFRATADLLPPRTPRPKPRATVVDAVPPDLANSIRARQHADVSDVPVYRGPAVDAAAKARGAKAFASGGAVFLPDEAGPTDSPKARGVLAHELVHAVQQRTLGPVLPAVDSPLGQQLEAEAQAAERFYGGEAGAEEPQPLIHAPQPAVAAPEAAPDMTAPAQLLTSPAQAPAPQPPAPVQSPFDAAARAEVGRIAEESARHVVTEWTNPRLAPGQAGTSGTSGSSATTQARPSFDRTARREEMARQTLEIINQERFEQGKEPLTDLDAAHYERIDRQLDDMQNGTTSSPSTPHRPSYRANSKEAWLHGLTGMDPNSGLGLTGLFAEPGSEQSWFQGPKDERPLAQRLMTGLGLATEESARQFDTDSWFADEPEQRSGTPGRQGTAAQRQNADSAAAHGAAGAHADDDEEPIPASRLDLDELSDRLYDRLRSRLRTELLVDRERAGLLSDFR
ncbi:eCIS core domain-containing protein [Actinophytocola sp. KF-1]